MNEKIRSLGEMTPEIVAQTEENITDVFIDEMLLHRAADDEVLDLLTDAPGECRDRLERLIVVYPQVDDFLAHVEEQFPEDMGERKRIQEGLALMLKLHVNQKERIASGLPFVAHPLAVAERVLATYKGPDASHVVVAALLHDAIEDQSRLLAFEKRLAHKDEYQVPENQIEHDGALDSLGHFFGMRVVTLVRMLTSPFEMKDSNMSQEERHAMYEQYVRTIFTDGDIGDAAAVIKWADLQENAFIKDLYDRAQWFRDKGRVEESESVMIFYRKMKEKYAPVLRIAREFFEQVQEGHPLYGEREAALSKIDEALENQYALA